jgi:hypothetical protein
LLTAVTNILNKSEISRWSNEISNVSDWILKFVRKAVIQQLATNANMKRWGRSESENCALCSKIQTNKHVLSNCSSEHALLRYRGRHDAVLEILAQWIFNSILKGYSLYADLTDSRYKPLNEIFQTLRPDIVVVWEKSIVALELTVCHETNFSSSKEYKLKNTRI